MLRWSVVKLPVLNEGVGVRDFKIFNEVLLSNWLWRFMNERDSLWIRVICTKYSVKGFG